LIQIDPAAAHNAMVAGIKAFRGSATLWERLYRAYGQPIG
jgi:hypothetical protein